MKGRTTFNVLLLFMAFFLTWGGEMTAQDSYSYEFADSKSVQKSVQTQQVDLGERSWTLATEAAGGLGYVNFDAKKGIQLGSKNNPAGAFALSTTGFSGTITKITVNTSGASNVKGTMYVTVGGVQWGDKVVLTKTATDYSFTGSAAGEVSLNYDVTEKACYIRSITIEYEGGTPSKPKAQLTFDATTATATLGEAFAAPTLTTTPEGIAVTYSSSNTDVATVDASTGAVTPIKAGTTTITATFAGNDDYTEASASYELTVRDESQTMSEETFDLTANGYENGEQVTTVNGTDATLLFAKSDGTTDPAYYNTGTAVRLYENNTLTITSQKAIAKVEFVMTANGSTKMENFSITPAGFDAETYTWTGNAKEITVTSTASSGHFRIQKITVYFATSSTTIPITIATDEGYATLYTDQAYTLPEGLKATSVQYAGNGSSLSMGWEYTAGDIVPAQTALLIQSLDGKSGEYTAEVASNATSAKQPTAGNCLYGTAAEETPADDGQSHYYKLTYSNVDGVKTLGFYWDNETGAPFTNKGGKAYLKLPKEETAAVKGFTIGGGAVTGISGVTTDSRQADAVYTISGVRVQGDPATLPQGIYIVGGKKVLVK